MKLIHISCYLQIFAASFSTGQANIESSTTSVTPMGWWQHDRHWLLWLKHSE